MKSLYQSITCLKNVAIFKLNLLSFSIHITKTLFLITFLVGLFPSHSQSSNDYLLALQSLHSEIRSYEDSHQADQINENLILSCNYHDSETGCQQYDSLWWKDIAIVEKRRVRTEHRSYFTDDVTYTYHNTIQLRNKEKYDPMDSTYVVVALYLNDEADSEKVSLFIKGILKYSKLRGGSPKLVDVNILGN